MAANFVWKLAGILDAGKNKAKCAQAICSGPPPANIRKGHRYLKAPPDTGMAFAEPAQAN